MPGPDQIGYGSISSQVAVDFVFEAVATRIDLGIKLRRIANPRLKVQEVKFEGLVIDGNCIHPLINDGHEDGYWALGGVELLNWFATNMSRARFLAIDWKGKTGKVEYQSAYLDEIGVDNKEFRRKKESRKGVKDRFYARVGERVSLEEWLMRDIKDGEGRIMGLMKGLTEAGLWGSEYLERRLNR